MSEIYSMLQFTNKFSRKFSLNMWFSLWAWES